MLALSRQVPTALRGHELLLVRVQARCEVALIDHPRVLTAESVLFFIFHDVRGLAHELLKISLEERTAQRVTVLLAQFVVVSLDQGLLQAVRRDYIFNQEG